MGPSHCCQNLQNSNLNHQTLPKFIFSLVLGLISLYRNNVFVFNSVENITLLSVGSTGQVLV